MGPLTVHIISLHNFRFELQYEGYNIPQRLDPLRSLWVGPNLHISKYLSFSLGFLVMPIQHSSPGTTSGHMSAVHCKVKSYMARMHHVELFVENRYNFFLMNLYIFNM